MGFAKLKGDFLLSAKNNSPKIKFIFAVLSFGAALYTTHKAALKSVQIKKKKQELLDVIEEAKEMAANGDLPDVEGLDTYTEEDYKLDLRKTNFEYVLDLGKNYALPVLFAGASIYLFHDACMDYKNVAVGIGAAYNTLLMKYNDKMAFYKKELGDEKFGEMEEGFKTRQITKAQSTGLTDENSKREIRNKCNPYSRFFDETHPAWTDNPDLNKMWLLGKQNELEERLQRIGHLYLNEAYDYCGYEPTKAGQVMGWIRDNPDGTTNHVDFGIFNISDQASRWFVNGLEPVFLINFNICPDPITKMIKWKDV